MRKQKRGTGVRRAPFSRCVQAQAEIFRHFFSNAFFRAMALATRVAPLCQPSEIGSPQSVLAVSTTPLSAVGTTLTKPKSLLPIGCIPAAVPLTQMDTPSLQTRQSLVRLPMLERSHNDSRSWRHPTYIKTQPILYQSGLQKRRRPSEDELERLLAKIDQVERKFELARPKRRGSKEEQHLLLAPSAETVDAVLAQSRRVAEKIKPLPSGRHAKKVDARDTKVVTARSSVASAAVVAEQQRMRERKFERDRRSLEKIIASLAHTRPGARIRVLFLAVEGVLTTVNSCSQASPTTPDEVSTGWGAVSNTKNTGVDKSTGTASPSRPMSSISAAQTDEKALRVFSTASRGSRRSESAPISPAQSTLAQRWRLDDRLVNRFCSALKKVPGLRVVVSSPVRYEASALLDLVMALKRNRVRVLDWTPINGRRDDRAGEIRTWLEENGGEYHILYWVALDTQKLFRDESRSEKAVDQRRVGTGMCVVVDPRHGLRSDDVDAVVHALQSAQNASVAGENGTRSPHICCCTC